MINSNFIRLNTAIIPTEEFYELAINASSQISEKFETHFTLSSASPLPHITVYPPEYPEVNVEQVIDRVKEIADITNPFEIHVRGISGYQGWISINFEVSEEIMRFHEAVVESLNPLRDGRLRAKYHEKEYLVALSDEDVQIIQKYGYPGVLDRYNPHLTITRLKNEDDMKGAVSIVESLLPKKSMMMNQIGIHKTGPHGTVTEVVSRFELSS